MTHSLIGYWTRNHVRGPIHPHPKGWGLLYPLTPGVKTGKYLTKTNLLAILQKEITNYDFITQKNQTSLFKKTLMCLAYTNILHIMKDTEEIEEWSFNISSLIYLGVTIIVSIYIRHTIEYMFKIIDLL